VFVNNAIKIKRVPAMDMTYQSTVRTVQIIVHMIVNSEEILVLLDMLDQTEALFTPLAFLFFFLSPSK
jgi:hypothetical protein